jgi:hypothetical protein
MQSTLALREVFRQHESFLLVVLWGQGMKKLAQLRTPKDSAYRVFWCDITFHDQDVVSSCSLTNSRLCLVALVVCDHADQKLVQTAH